MIVYFSLTLARTIIMTTKTKQQVVNPQSIQQLPLQQSVDFKQPHQD